MLKSIPTLIPVLLLSCVLAASTFAEEISTAGKIETADNASIQAVKQAAASRATCNPALLKHAVESIDQAAGLLSGLAVEADNTGNLELAQEVYDMATNEVGQGIGFIKEVCIHCTQGGLDRIAVKRFQKSCSGIYEPAKVNEETIDAALAAGAIPPRDESEGP